jgi:hypothetical protein
MLTGTLFVTPLSIVTLGKGFTEFRTSLCRVFYPISKYYQLSGSGPHHPWLELSFRFGCKRPFDGKTHEVHHEGKQAKQMRIKSSGSILLPLIAISSGITANITT